MSPDIAPGAKVQITAGLAAGVVGVVIDKWPIPLYRGGPAQWRVRSDDLVRTRVVRADYLKVLP